MIFANSIPANPFNQWLRTEPENQRLLGFCAIATLLSIICLKLIYPYPNFMPPDSYSYVDAAYNNQFINMWAIGYSKFLRLISSFTNSHLILIIIQYLLLQTCILYFLFTIRYLLSPGKWLFRILVCFSVMNPLIPQISNFVSSDAL